jgi:hypothetical protein
MINIADEIREVEREHALNVRPIPAPERDLLRERLVRRFSSGRARLWEDSTDSVSVHSREAWRWISDFVSSRSCVLLFDASDEIEMFAVPSGPVLEQLLANSFGFEFYVTDRDASYLICFNHHDFLICWGSAKEWLMGRHMAG